METRYYLWCHARQMWWKPHRLGYTDDLEQAGDYSQNEAIEICTKANRTGLEESMVPMQSMEEYKRFRP